jgi:hypothetical protein
LCELPAKRAGIDEEDEGALAVDLHNRQPLAVLLLELVVPADVDLCEGLLIDLRAQDCASLVAEAAVRRVVEDDAGYG